MMGHKFLRAATLAFAVFCAMGVAVAEEPTISVETRQRYPWNGLVDIKFTVTGKSGGRYDTSFVAKDMVGGTNITMKTIRKSDGSVAAEKERLLPGSYNWVWEAAADLPKDFECDRMVVNGKAIYCPLYIVIDLSSGADSEKYPVSYLDEEPSEGWTDEYKTTKLVLRRIEPGTFKMGDTKNVTMKKTFYMGIFEVTQKQYCLVTGSSPWENSNVYKSIGDCFPAVNISWNDIRGNSSVHNWPTIKTVDSNSFVGRIRSKSGLSIDLPTEAQWEYSVRAGTTTRHYWGNDVAAKYEWFYSTSHCENYCKVGLLQSNPWGLYDTIGNAQEWCLDWFDSLKYGSEIDSEGPSSPGWNSGFYGRVLRGGDYSEQLTIFDNLSVFYRSHQSPSSRSFNEFCIFYGFRVAVTLTE